MFHAKFNRNWPKNFPLFATCHFAYFGKAGIKMDKVALKVVNFWTFCPTFDKRDYKKVVVPRKSNGFCEGFTDQLEIVTSYYKYKIDTLHIGWFSILKLLNIVKSMYF